MLRGKMDNSRYLYYLENTYPDELGKGCLIWGGNTSQGNHGKADYAVAEIHGEKFYVHRYMAFASYSEEERRALWDDPTVQVMHSCDVKLCINPCHLEIGNQSKNIRDAIDRGLKVAVKGIDHPRALLTEEQVLEIRALCSCGIVSQRTLAKMYGVSQPTIGAIATRRIWKHI